MEQSLYEQKKIILIEEITAAFEGVSRENGVSLSESWVIDNYGTEQERVEARRKDTETQWQDVPDDDIANGYSCLSFMDEIGFRYYIPAYIVWFLRNTDSEEPESPSFDSNTYESLLYKIEYFPSRFKHFTLKQSQSIAHFLEFEAEREDGWRAKREQSWREMMSQRSYSQKEIDDQWDVDGNDARRALERYWGQFIGQ